MALNLTLQILERAEDAKDEGRKSREERGSQIKKSREERAGGLGKLKVTE